MTIELETQLLSRSNISANQYMLLYLLNKKHYDVLNMYLYAIDFKFFEEDINDLIEKNYLRKYGYSTPLDIRGYELTNTGMEIVTDNINDYFDEFLKEFPDKVYNNGVTRYLKSDISRCRAKYNRLTKGKRHLHEHITKCLRFEIALRERTNNMGYFKKLPTWLDSEEWKAYEKDAYDTLTTETQEQYGSSLE